VTSKFLYSLDLSDDNGEIFVWDTSDGEVEDSFHNPVFGQISSLTWVHLTKQRQEWHPAFVVGTASGAILLYRLIVGANIGSSFDVNVLLERRMAFRETCQRA
jgi:hypothetical protein